MTIDSGGPAYPVPEQRLDDGTGIREGHDGMTLRQTYAMHMVPNSLNHERAEAIRRYGRVDATGVDEVKLAVALAFKIADAMIAHEKAGK